METRNNRDPRKPINQDHVSTEHAFKRLLGGNYNVDADYFRNMMVNPKGWENY